MYKNKLIRLFFIIATTLLATASMAQENDYEQLSKIIKSGNAKDLVKQFSNIVELNIDGEEASYSRAQAEAVLKDFFNKYPPQAFTINHKGASKGGLPYIIGEYKNSAGNYRVWIRLKNVNGRKLVYEMSFILE
jgi:Domain of unknown function (DUF4783)